uniref:Uncharacterized protein n=1 Tax=Anguilla anguilla TaxID=7936 RepID=A0A0E9Q255_ANGAN
MFIRLTQLNFINCISLPLTAHWKQDVDVSINSMLASPKYNNAILSS